MTANAVAFVRGIIPDAENREKDDWYPSPPEATAGLLSAETFDGPIWECACGDGAISEPLKAAGYEVVSSDLVDRGYGDSNIDFLMEWQGRAPNIVTNPPFKLAEQFVHKALELSTGKVAILARLAWLEGIERRDTIFLNTPIARVHVFSKRLHMQRARQAEKTDAGGMIAFAWFVWEHGYTGRPTLGWL
jgi:hypothetical protein